MFMEEITSAGPEGHPD